MEIARDVAKYAHRVREIDRWRGDHAVMRHASKAAWAMVVVMAAPHVHAASAARTAERAQYSLHIGVNQAPPESGLVKLRFADDDAWRMASFFASTAVHTEWLAVIDDQTRRRESARLLSPPPPTVREVERALARLRERMRDDVARNVPVELVFTFSGHGVVKDGKVQLALLDGMLSQTFFDALAGWPEIARLHLILDACHAGGVFTGRGFRSEGMATTTTIGKVSTSLNDPNWFSRRPHVGALLSSSASGLSHEWSRIEGGLFSHEVLSALRGAADVDGNQRITYDEVAAFSTLAKSTLADPGGAGAVVVYPPAQEPFVALSRLETLAEGRLNVPPRRRIWVRYGDGRSLVHVHTGAQTSASLRLPTEVELVAVDEDEREAVFILKPRASTDLVALSFQQTAATRGVIEGPQKGWLQRPFTPDFFHGWTQRDTAAGDAAANAGSSAAPRAVASSKVGPKSEFPILAVGGLAAVAVGAAALTALSGLWMVTSAQAYNQTEFEVAAAEASADYAAAAASAVMLGTLSLGSAAAAGIWWWVATRPPE